MDDRYNEVERLFQGAEIGRVISNATIREARAKYRSILTERDRLVENAAHWEKMYREMLEHLEKCDIRARRAFAALKKMRIVVNELLDCRPVCDYCGKPRRVCESKPGMGCSKARLVSAVNSAKIQTGE